MDSNIPTQSVQPEVPVSQSIPEIHHKFNKIKIILFILLGLIILGTVGVSGYYLGIKSQKNQFITNSTTTTKLIGGEKDMHGCLVAAGYTWCEEKNKCLKKWEESCQSSSIAERSDVLEYSSFVVASKDWVVLKSNKLGISLNYPSPKGLINFNYLDLDLAKITGNVSGQEYAWMLTDETGWTCGIAGGISENHSAGRDIWATDFYKLKPEDYSNAITVLKTIYKTDAVLSRWKMLEKEDDKGMVIKVDLPFKDTIPFKGIAIYSPSGFSTEEAKAIVESIKLEE